MTCQTKDPLKHALHCRIPMAATLLQKPRTQLRLQHSCMEQPTENGSNWSNRSSQRASQLYRIPMAATLLQNPRTQLRLQHSCIVQPIENGSNWSNRASQRASQLYCRIPT